MRTTTSRSDEGFGLVELVITMFVLLMIAIAMLPALYNGIGFSSQQSQTATATRFLYSTIEQARQEAQSSPSTTDWCDGLRSAAAVPPDGASFTASVDTCAPDASGLVSVVLTATSTGPVAKVIATATAKVYVP